MLHIDDKTNGRGDPVGHKFWRYFVAQSISSLGSIVGRMALGLLVYDMTGSEWAMGALLLVSSIPEIVLRLLGAPLIDRFHRLKLMAFLDVVRFATYLLAWVAFTTGAAGLWIFYLQAAITGITGALYMPAAMAIIPSLVPTEKLDRANGLNRTFMNAQWVIGPMIAAALCTLLGNANAVLLDGISFGLCSLMLITIAAKQEIRLANGRKGAKGYVADLAEGFVIFRQIPALLSITVVLAISNIGSFGSSSMMIPYVRDYLGAPTSVLGFIEAGLPFGALVGSLVVTAGILHFRRRHLMLSGLLLIQIAQLIGAFVTRQSTFLMVPGMILWGIGLNLYSIHSDSIYQKLVPDELRGRVMSVRVLVGTGMGPVGTFIGTAIAAKWDPSITMLIGGGIPFLITLSAFFLPSIRGLDRLEEAPKASDSPAAKQGAPAVAANSSQ